MLYCDVHCVHSILSNCYDIFVSIGLFKTNDSLILHAIAKEYNCVYLDTNLIQWEKNGDRDRVKIKSAIVKKAMM